MNLNEQTNRIKQMMGINEDISPAIRRRLHLIKSVLSETLYSSYPCDYDSFYHYLEGVMFDMEVFMGNYELENLTFDDVEKYVKEYLIDDIETYYVNKTKDCENTTKTEDEELSEYSRTLKNARQQGVGLRFPKSAIKSNPTRFRPYNR